MLEKSEKVELYHLPLVVLRKKWQNVAFKMAKKRCLLKG